MATLIASPSERFPSTREIPSRSGCERVLTSRQLTRGSARMTRFGVSVLTCSVIFLLLEITLIDVFSYWDAARRTVVNEGGRMRASWSHSLRSAAVLVFAVFPAGNSLWCQQSSAGQTRTEKGLLGERQVPANAYHCVQTLRALENFPLVSIE